MSRDLGDLRADMREYAESMLSLAAERGLDVLVYCTRRSFEEQARLYRQGRPTAEIHATAHKLERDWGRPDLAEILLDVGPQYGDVRTNAAPGQSLHNYGAALDAAPMREGEIVWTTQHPADRQLWEAYGACVRDAGLVWGGDWHRFVDMPHAQLPDIHWEDLIRRA